MCYNNLMPKFESVGSNESLKRSVHRKALAVLHNSEARPLHSFFDKGNTTIAGIAKLVIGQKTERTASLDVGNGYQWVAIHEQSSQRFGSHSVETLILNGDRMLDTEGRNTQRLWQYELIKGNYQAEDYMLLDELFDVTREARQDIFDQLAELNKDNHRP